MRNETDGTSSGRGRNGLSLLEVLIATLVFMLAAIPIYRAITIGATKEIDSTKLSMARKILDSFRSEVMSRPFKELSEQNPSNSETFVKMEGGYPETIDKVMEIQTKYKDFKLEPEIRFTTPNKTILEFRGVVKWTNSEGIARQEEIIFLAVKP
ncbi:MAG TPA: hypothetical protein PLU72_04775 [Candidatus Ozemobacteraceae bacterium]|nr:hypothetical protein [Candidatus Ozemobacteraceae bacterium]